MSANIPNDAIPVGRPRVVTDKLQANVIAFLFKTTLQKGNMPEDSSAAEQFGISERSFRSIRLRYGLDRWTIRRFLKSAEKSDTQDNRFKTPTRTKETEQHSACDSTHTDNCISLGYTPFGGAWLLIPLLFKSAIVKAISHLRMPKGVQKATDDFVLPRVTAWQFVLTILWWSILGFERFFHLDDFRSKSDLGLALLTGRVKLLADFRLDLTKKVDLGLSNQDKDSTLWRVLHSLPKESIEAFYQATASSTINPNDPDSATKVSLDDHVVPSFTELDPKPLGRVPTRGRSYPAVRLYYYYDLIKHKFMFNTSAYLFSSSVLAQNGSCNRTATETPSDFGEIRRGGSGYI